MIVWIGLIVGSLLTILTAFWSFKEEVEDLKKEGKKSNFHKRIFALAVIGALMTLMAGIDSKIEEEESTAKADRLNDSLINSQKLNTQLLLEQKDSTMRVIFSQNEIIAANKKLQNANSKIQFLQDSLIKNVIGDGNFPRLVISCAQATDKHYMLEMRVINQGKTPLRGLRAIVGDGYSGLLKVESIDTTRGRFGFKGFSLHNPNETYDESYKKWQKEISIGNLPPDTHHSFYYPQIPKIFPEFRLQIKLFWDNGSKYCALTGIKVENKEFPFLKVGDAISVGFSEESSFARVINFN